MSFWYFGKKSHCQVHQGLEHILHGFTEVTGKKRNSDSFIASFRDFASFLEVIYSFVCSTGHVCVATVMYRYSWDVLLSPDDILA